MPEQPVVLGQEQCVQLLLQQQRPLQPQSLPHSQRPRCWRREQVRLRHLHQHQ